MSEQPTLDNYIDLAAKAVRDFNINVLESIWVMIQKMDPHTDKDMHAYIEATVGLLSSDKIWNVHTLFENHTEFQIKYLIDWVLRTVNGDVIFIRNYANEGDCKKRIVTKLARSKKEPAIQLIRTKLICIDMNDQISLTDIKSIEENSYIYRNALWDAIKMDKAIVAYFLMERVGWYDFHTFEGCEDYGIRFHQTILKTKDCHNWCDNNLGSVEENELGAFKMMVDYKSLNTLKRMIDEGAVYACEKKIAYVNNHEVLNFEEKKKVLRLILDEGK